MKCEMVWDVTLCNKYNGIPHMKLVGGKYHIENHLFARKEDAEEFVKAWTSCSASKPQYRSWDVEQIAAPWNTDHRIKLEDKPRRECGSINRRRIVEVHTP